MAYDHMNLTEGEEFYADEFGERILGADPAPDDEAELIIDEAAEDEMTPVADSSDDTFGETLSSDDSADAPPTDDSDAIDTGMSKDASRDPNRDTWAG